MNHKKYCFQTMRVEREDLKFIFEITLLRVLAYEALED